MGLPTARAADPVQRARLLARVREAVLSGAPPPLAPRPVVSDSWRRSLAARVDPERGAGPPTVYQRTEMAELRAEHPMADALPLLRETLVSIADEAVHMMIVTDAHGHILWREGRLDVLRRADQVGLVEGTCWSESAIGTNAMGTALAEGAAVQIHSAEHLVRAYHSWTCAASPVRDPDTGRIVGVVDVTGPVRSFHPSTPALVGAAAKLAEGQLRLRMHRRDEALRLRCAPRLAALRGEYAALVTPSGRVLASEPGDWLPATRLAVPAPDGGQLVLPDGRPATLEPLTEGFLLRSGRGARRTCPRPAGGDGARAAHRPTPTADSATAARHPAWRDGRLDPTTPVERPTGRAPGHEGSAGPRAGHPGGGRDTDRADRPAPGSTAPHGGPLGAPAGGRHPAGAGTPVGGRRPVEGSGPGTAASPTATDPRDPPIGPSPTGTGPRPGDGGDPGPGVRVAARLRFRFLGHAPTAELNGRLLRLTQRHADMLTLLALRPDGVNADGLATGIYGERGNPVTARAEIHRLRAQLGAGVVRSGPYRLEAEVVADFLTVRTELRVGHVRAAAGAYRGVLRPGSEAPAVIEERELLDATVRRAVLDAGDVEAMWLLAETEDAAHDVELAERLASALPPSDPRHAAMAARAAHLTRATPGSGPGRGLAAVRGGRRAGGNL